MSVPVFCVAFLAGFAAVLSVLNLNAIERVEHRVGCIERPFGASSIATTRINGRFVVTQPAHRTGCP